MGELEQLMAMNVPGSTKDWKKKCVGHEPSNKFESDVTWFWRQLKLPVHRDILQKYCHFSQETKNKLELTLPLDSQQELTIYIYSELCQLSLSVIATTFINYSSATEYY